MGKFRRSDASRVEAVFAEALPEAFEAEVTLSNGSTTMTVTVMDPDDETIPVANCSFEFDQSPLKARAVQPNEDEVASIAASFAQICTDYAG